MNVFGELMLWLICIGFIWGIIVTALVILIEWLVYKLWGETDGKH